MSTRKLIMAVLAVAFLCTSAIADWDPGMDYKMHYPQLPDLNNGLDVLAGYTLQPVPTVKFLADDFLCTETGPITDVHIWGSWLNDLWPDPGVVPGGHGTFILALYDDIPAGVVEPWSMPGELLWRTQFKPGEYQARLYENAPEEFYDPNQNVILGADNTVWQYNFYIDEPLAWQQEVGKTYWLAVANVDPNNDGLIDVTDLTNVAADNLRFGWKTSMDPWNDDAVFIDVVNDPFGQLVDAIEPPMGAPLPWQELISPLTGESLDLSFVITPEPATLALLSLGALAVLRKR